MTSSLLKRRRTTRRNMPAANDGGCSSPRVAPRRGGWPATLSVVFVALIGGVSQAASWHDLFGGTPARPTAETSGIVERTTPLAGQPRALDVAAVLEGGQASSRAGSASRALATRPAHGEGVTTVAAKETLASRRDDEMCAADAEACRQALEQLRLDYISEIDLDIRVDGVAGNDYPCECRLDGEVFVPRQFATTTFTWKAAGYCHKPLYFEHWNFERYGHSYGWAADPFISAAHFFGTLPILPYKMGVELPWECVYPLGYYRPGNCAPWTVPAFPVSVRGMAVEAATVTGIVFLLP
jgi:hypothetical protein